MEHIKKGCIAVRKSYKKDILFKIRKIIKTKHGKIAILHGITERIEADIYFFGDEVAQRSGRHRLS